MNEAQKTWRLAHADHLRAYFKARYRANKKAFLEACRARYQAKPKEERQASARANYLAHREERLARQKAYSNEHKQEEALRAREWARRNPERRAAIVKKYYQTHVRHRDPEKVRRAKEKYYKANREKVILKAKLWKQAHPEKVKLWGRIHRAKRRAQMSSSAPIVQTFYEGLRKRAFVKCYWCGAKISGKEIQVDHVIALSKGGNHAIENLAASCAACNQSKHARLPHEWAKHPQMFFTL
jgi:5-methylcytosine-specific restriction endonuclease McrA